MIKEPIIKAWAVMRPDGKLIVNTVNDSKRWAFIAAGCYAKCGAMKGREWKKIGYKAIRVLITPIK